MKPVVAAALVAALVAAAGRAGANGRPAGVSTITFRHGHEADIAAGATFGLVVSHDGGATWHWMCEDALGYSGLYDPDYAYSGGGTLFDGTYSGLLASRDGCTFDRTSLGKASAPHVEIGGDGAVYVATSDATDVRIYRSIDDGMTFPQATLPPDSADAFWSSLVVAPSNPARVYLTGYRALRRCWVGKTHAGACGSDADCAVQYPHRVTHCDLLLQYLLYASDDAGATFHAMSTDALDIALGASPAVVGVDARNPDVVYLRIATENGISRDGLYRSTDAGATWTKLAATFEPMSFVARASGELVYATQNHGAFHSTDGGATWQPLSGAPHISFLTENSAGEVWAATVNTASMGAPQADGFGIMKSTDLQTWTGVLRFQDISSPIACAPGTVQHDTCAPQWCCLASQLSITSTEIDCTGSNACFQPDGPPAPPKGCCDADGAPGTLGLLMPGLIGLVILRRRRRANPTHRLVSE